MSEQTNRKKDKKSVHVRLGADTIDWLERQKDEETPTATHVARRIIIKEKKRQAKKQSGGG